ncbi:MAG: hypothetical protein Fur009_3540 [Candidatus Microgenomates bacterium]
MSRKERFEISQYPTEITINPGKLTRNGQLFTTQNFTHPDKLKRAINGEIDLEDNPIPVAWYWGEKGAIVLGDGNHRVAIAYLNEESLLIKLIGPFSKNIKPIPFKKFLIDNVSGWGLEI